MKSDPSELGYDGSYINVRIVIKSEQQQKLTEDNHGTKRIWICMQYKHDMI